MAFISKDTSEPPNDAEEGTSKPTGWQADDKQHGSPHSSNTTGKRNKPILDQKTTIYHLWRKMGQKVVRCGI